MPHFLSLPCINFLLQRKCSSPKFLGFPNPDPLTLLALRWPWGSCSFCASSLALRDASSSGPVARAHTSLLARIVLHSSCSSSSHSSPILPRLCKGLWTQILNLIDKHISLPSPAPANGLLRPGWGADHPAHSVPAGLPTLLIHDDFPPPRCPASPFSCCSSTLRHHRPWDSGF